MMIRENIFENSAFSDMKLPFGNERAYPVLWKQIYMYIFHDSIGYNVKEQTTGLCLCFYFCSLYFYKKVTTPCFYQNIFQMKITPQFTETPSLTL